MSDNKHTGKWKLTPGKEDIRPVERTTDLKICVVCGRISGNKSRYMDNALGQRISIAVCGNTCFANYLEKQARLVTDLCIV